jgi:hypothetical protein
LLAGFVFFLSVGRAADESAPVEFAPKWKVGQRLNYGLTTAQNQKITAAMSPQPMDQTTRQSQSFSVTVDKEREGGGHELAVEFLGLSLESEMNGNTVLKFDSKSDPKDDAGNPAAVMMRPIANAKFRILTRANGKVDAVQGLKEILSSVASGGNPMMAGMTESMINEDAIKQMGIVPNWFPGKPVKPGDQWPVRFDIAIGPMGKINVSQTMTLKGWEEKQGRQCVLIETKGYLTGGPGSGANTNLMSITSLSGDTKGRMWFDPALGALVESNEDQNMRLKMKAMGQEISTQMTQSVTNALKEVSSVK